MVKRVSSMVGRMDEDSFHLARKVVFKRLERKEIVPEDQLIIEDVLFFDPVCGVVGILGVLKQDARLKARTVLFAHPCQFEFLFVGHVRSPICGAFADRKSKRAFWGYGSPGVALPCSGAPAGSVARPSCVTLRDCRPGRTSPGLRTH